MDTQRTPFFLTSAFLFVPILLLLSGTGLLTLPTDASPVFFLRDPKSIYEIPFHAGALSNIGVLLWCATASVCVFTALVLHTASAEPNKRKFLLSAGLLTSLLLFDDFFLLHEVFAPQYLGISANVLFFLYAVLSAALFVVFRRVVLRSAYALLLISGVFFSLSILFDELQMIILSAAPDLRGLQYLLEDGSKLIGITGWFNYFGWCSYTSLVQLHYASD